MKTCSRCGKDRLYRFQPSGPLPEAQLPVVCRDCGLITVDGKPVGLPPEIEQQAVSLATEASKSADEAAAELEQQPELTEQDRIRQYMGRFYSKAYLDGFFRALAFFRHHAKEGRIRRIRKIWSSARIDIPRGSSDVVVRLDGDLYTEFEQLLYLSTQGSGDATGFPHERPSVPKSNAHMP